MSVVDRYKDIPVSARFGTGYYTYKLVIESPRYGMSKVEFAANEVNSALTLACSYIGGASSWNYMNKDVITICSILDPKATCLLYCG